jgi:hypothetical protein
MTKPNKMLASGGTTIPVRSPQQHEYVDLLSQLEASRRIGFELLDKLDRVWWSMGDTERLQIDEILKSSPHRRKDNWQRKQRR